MLHVRVVEAKDLESGDHNGLSDPYVKLTYGRQKAKTKSVAETLYPVWDESFTFKTDSSPPSDKELCDKKILVRVFDHDCICSDDFLGAVEIDLSELSGPAPAAKKPGDDVEESDDDDDDDDYEDESDEEKKKKPAAKKSSKKKKDPNTASPAINRWFPLYDKALKRRVNGHVFIRVVVDIDRTADMKQKKRAFEQHRNTLLHTKSRLVGEDSGAMIKMFVGTWNVGNAAPPDDLSAWLKAGGARDVIVIGAQECQYDIRDRPHKSINADWLATVQRTVGEKYVLVAQKSLWEMRLLVFVTRLLRPDVTNVVASTEATGLASVLGNKGGVVVAMNIKDTSIAFVNSHLAAHQHKTKKRNDDVREIINGVNIGRRSMDLLHQFHHVVWFGDLNYRLDYGDQGDEKTPSEKQFNEMVDRIKKEEFEDLLKTDQLLREMKEERVFVRFNEGFIDFPPTFKVQRDVEFGYLKQRSPAWTDRILWKSVEAIDGLHLEQNDLASSPTVTTSDHKPVWCTFDMRALVLPSGVNSLLGHCRINISELKGVELPAVDRNGLSDPYVLFTANFLKRDVVTSVQHNTVNPNWAGEELELLECRVNSKARLRMAFLMVSVLDNERSGGSRRIACGEIPLAPFVEGPDDEGREDARDFSINLSSGGRNSGKLTGKLQVLWGRAKFEQKLME